MNIYHLSRQEPIDHEEHSALVVIAATEHEARNRAAQLCGTEGETPWLERAACDAIGIAFADIDPHSFACIDCLEA